MTETSDKLRVDKWLWHARFFKSRGIAAEAVSSGGLRVNGNRIAKPSYAIRAGDVLTFPKAGHVRVIRIDMLGQRRGPAVEAVTLYTDLDPPLPAERPAAAVVIEAGAGRPTKRDRREIDALRGRRP